MIHRRIWLMCCLVVLAARSEAQEAAAAVDAYAMTPERLGASVGMLVALIGVVIGAWSLIRTRPTGGVVALTTGLIGAVVGGLIVITADGGLGTGNGLGGGVVAIVLGVIGMALGGLARARSRRTA